MQAHGWRQLLPFSWDDETSTLERVERLEDGRVVLLSIQEADERRLHVTASETMDESALRALIRRMLQLDLPIDAFHAYCAARPELAHVPVKRQGRLLTSPTVFEDVLKVIATTNTTWSQTKAMIARIVNSYGTPLAGDPKRRAFPRPDQIAAVSLDEFSANARMGYRNASVHRIATDVASGALNLETWFDPKISSPDLSKRLLSLPGVGPYAASCLMIYLGRYDRVNVDSWARMMVGKEVGRPVTDKEVHAFFEPYGEWKALAYHFYPWKEEELAD